MFLKPHSYLVALPGFEVTNVSRQAREGWGMSYFWIARIQLRKAGLSPPHEPPTGVFACEQTTRQKVKLTKQKSKAPGDGRVSELFPAEA